MQTQKKKKKRECVVREKLGVVNWEMVTVGSALGERKYIASLPECIHKRKSVQQLVRVVSLLVSTY